MSTALSPSPVLTASQKVVGMRKVRCQPPLNLPQAWGRIRRHARFLFLPRRSGEVRRGLKSVFPTFCDGVKIDEPAQREHCSHPQAELGVAPDTHYSTGCSDCLSSGVAKPQEASEIHFALVLTTFSPTPLTFCRSVDLWTRNRPMCPVAQDFVSPSTWARLRGQRKGRYRGG